MTRPGPLRRILRLGHPDGANRFPLAALTGTAAAGSVVGLGATSAWLIARAAEHPPVLYLMVAIVAVRAFGLGRAVMRYTERLTGHDTALRILTELRVATYRRLATLTPARLRRRHSGDLAARLVDDIDGLTDLWLRLLLPYTIAALAGAGTVVLLAVLLPTAAIVLAASLLTVALAAPAAAAALSRRAETRIAPLRGDLHTTTVDLLHGAAEVVAAGAADRELARVSAIDRRLHAAHRRAAVGQGTGTAVSILAAGATVWASLALGAPAVRAGTLTGVLLAVVVLAPLAIHDVYAALPAAAAELPRLRSTAGRVTDLLDQTDPDHEPDPPAAGPRPPYHLRLAGVTAGWVPGGPAVLRDLDLDLPAGSRVAVTGGSGAGKTTLAAVLLRFLTPTAGRVTLGGTDLSQLTGDQVRRVVGLCAQDAHVFDSTIAENLRLARPEAGTEQLRAALRRARLLSWVDTLPAGLDTYVGEHGRRLSGGQRQRLALARALLADVAVLILDEPTEHLDEPTAAALTHDLLAAAAGRTVLLLTHRHPDPADVDRILRLDAGRLTRTQPSALTPGITRSPTSSRNSTGSRPGSGINSSSSIPSPA